ncbi:MAG: carboxypeptidase-like regulatory domain-containing protein [Candidatus Eremiobacterota bacterium]
MIKKLYLFAVIIMIFTGLAGCGDRVITPSDLTYTNTDITIAGTVTNSDMPVPGAYVRLYQIKGQSSAFLNSQSTDLAGRYIFTDLSSGTYRVEAWYNKSLYERGQDCTGGNNINAAGAGNYISYIVNGAVAPTPRVTTVPSAKK